jgi:hypothetical protein
MDGKLVVLVRGYYPDEDVSGTPQVGSVVRVEGNGLLLEKTVEANGCVIFEDAALVSPVSIHTFIPDYGILSRIGDPRRAQAVRSDLRKPEEDPPVEPPVARVHFSVKDLNVLPEETTSDRRLIDARLSDGQQLIFDPENNPFTLPVAPGEPLTVLAGGGLGFISDSFATVDSERFDVVTLPGINAGETREVELDLSIGLETSVEVSVETPARLLSGIGLQLGISLPNSGPSISVSSVTAFRACRILGTTTSAKSTRA